MCIVCAYYVYTKSIRITQNLGRKFIFSQYLGSISNLACISLLFKFLRCYMSNNAYKIISQKVLAMNLWVPIFILLVVPTWYNTVHTNSRPKKRIKMAKENLVFKASIKFKESTKQVKHRMTNILNKFSLKTN